MNTQTFFVPSQSYPTRTRDLCIVYSFFALAVLATLLWWRGGALADNATYESWLPSGMRGQRWQRKLDAGYWLQQATKAMKAQGLSASSQCEQNFGAGLIRSFKPFDFCSGDNSSVGSSARCFHWDNRRAQSFCISRNSEHRRSTAAAFTVVWLYLADHAPGCMHWMNARACQTGPRT